MVDIEITGQHIDVGEALRSRVEDALSGAIEKYFDRPAQARVTFSHEGSGYGCDVTAHLSSGIVLRSEGRAPDIHASFDAAVSKIEKRVRRYKRRLKDHQSQTKSDLPAMEASSYVLRAEADRDVEEEVGDQPVIVAETQSVISVLPVAAAVMRLELAEEPALVFRNAAHGRVNVVYRRSDGAIGWIDPPTADA